MDGWMDTVALVEEEGEGVSVAGVGVAAVAGGELLQALRRDVPEVARVRRVLRHHHRPPRHHRVDHRRRRRRRRRITALPLPRHRQHQHQEAEEEEEDETQLCRRQNNETRQGFGGLYNVAVLELVNGRKMTIMQCQTASWPSVSPGLFRR